MTGEQPPTWGAAATHKNPPYCLSTNYQDDKVALTKALGHEARPTAVVLPFRRQSASGLPGSVPRVELPFRIVAGSFRTSGSAKMRCA